MGGVAGGRPRCPEDLFESACERAFGEKLRAEHADGTDSQGGFYRNNCLGCRLWGSLANVDWMHGEEHFASYSFRAAGDLIAAIVGAGDYMDWYCSANHGTPYDDIVEGLAKEGWRPLPPTPEGA